MAIKFHKKSKDRINRKNFSSNEKLMRYYKFMVLKYNKMLKSNNKECTIYLSSLQKKLQSLPRTKINNYCILTGRDKGVYRDFRLSRHQVKQNFKFLTGLRNSSF